MKAKKRVHRIRHSVTYAVTIRRYFASVAGVVAMVTLAVILIYHFSHPQNSFSLAEVSANTIYVATVNSFIRLFVAYMFSVVVAVPVALLIVQSKRGERLLLPLADVAQSVPVLAFFPVVVVFFTNRNSFEPAAIFVIFVSMMWNIVFPVIGGLKAIPEDIEAASVVFNVRGFDKLRYLTLPAIFPFFVTGSLLAWAQAWTTVIVAEVLHTYIPHGNTSQDLLGLGSLLVDSNAGGKQSVFLAALIAMILVITLLNFLVWQPLLHLSGRFKFD